MERRWHTRRAYRSQADSRRVLLAGDGVVHLGAAGAHGLAFPPNRELAPDATSRSPTRRTSSSGRGRRRSRARPDRAPGSTARARRGSAGSEAAGCRPVCRPRETASQLRPGRRPEATSQQDTPARHGGRHSRGSNGRVCRRYPSKARRAASWIWRNVAGGSCALINRNRFPAHRCLDVSVGPRTDHRLNLQMPRAADLCDLVAVQRDG